ncbi:MAG: hypothetical protein ACLUD2_16915 [Clostridium sp.]
MTEALEALTGGSASEDRRSSIATGELACTLSEEAAWIRSKAKISSKKRASVRDPQ